ncbi:energy transducer TonB [Pseudoxanthomonas mexicana]|uniref:Energy transducer TonB n=1 Tax=Pseudoxanthomonas mexicana TaxID=128785 RepID=A0A7G9T9L3_PSEMX|nr:energy transducer TonB [Pseudoxanthomonas mexicana]QNN76788.1 energy transducer TonB [Pseudoxanthomonas mexicana]
MHSNPSQPSGHRMRATAWLHRHTRLVAVTCSLALHLMLLLFAFGQWRLQTQLPVLIEDRVRIQMYLAPPSAPPVPVAPQEAPVLTPDSSAAEDRPEQAAPAPAPAPVLPPQHALLMPAAQEVGPSTQSSNGPASSTSVASVASQAAAPPSPSLPPAPTLAGMSEPDWVGEVLARLEKFRRYPRSAQMHAQQGVVYVRARISREGKVLAVQMRSSSGYALLDQEALETFRRARSLPPPPPALPDPVELDVPVEFFLR